MLKSRAVQKPLPYGDMVYVQEANPELECCFRLQWREPHLTTPNDPSQAAPQDMSKQAQKVTESWL